MPAAAVIPAPIAYINAVAVKKLVVGFRVGWTGLLPMGVCTGLFVPLLEECPCSSLSVGGTRAIYFEKIKAFQAGQCLEYVSME